eukprot:589341-Hanusia_phi.AAC.1
MVSKSKPACQHSPMALLASDFRLHAHSLCFRIILAALVASCAASDPNTRIPSNIVEAVQNGRSQALSTEKDPYKDGDPIKQKEYKEQFLHVDGTINEKVLLMIQQYSPLSAGAVPAGLGLFLFLLVVAVTLYSWMRTNMCFEPRMNATTERFREERRLKTLQQMEESSILRVCGPQISNAISASFIAPSLRTSQPFEGSMRSLTVYLPLR